MDEFETLLWGVQLSARYHARRQAFFERWNRTTIGVAAFLGSAAGGSALAHAPAALTAGLSFVLAANSAFDLAVGTRSMGTKHKRLRQQFLKLEAEIRRAGTAAAALTPALSSKRIQIEVDEPPIYTALYYLSYNELARAKGYRERRLVPWYRRWTANFVHGMNFVPRHSTVALDDRQTRHPEAGDRPLNPPSQA